MKKMWAKCTSLVLGSLIMLTGCSVPSMNAVKDQNQTANTLNVSTESLVKYKTVNVSIERPELYSDTVQVSSSFASLTTKSAALAKKSESITINSLSPQMVSLFGANENSPVAFSVVANPMKARTVLISPESTAQALVFMNPNLVTLDMEEADKVMNLIKTDANLGSLVRLIEVKTQKDPDFLNKEDNQLSDAVGKVVNSVVNKLAADFDRQVRADENPNRVNGVEINTLRQDSVTADLGFKNYYKRSVDLYFLNSGNVPVYKESLTSAFNFIDLDNLKLGRRPSERKVGLDIQREMTEVEMIGLGLKDIKQFKEDWQNMDQMTKMKYAVPMIGSLMNDFVSPIISIIVGFNVTKVHNASFQRLINSLPISEIMDHLRNKRYSQAFKAALSSTVKTLLEKNGALLRELLIAAGVNLTEAMIKKLTIVVGVFHLVRHGIEVARALYAYANTSITSYFSIDNSSGKMVFRSKTLAVAKER